MLVFANYVDFNMAAIKVARKLMAIMKPNPKKSRPSLRKKSDGQPEDLDDGVEIMGEYLVPVGDADFSGPVLSTPKPSSPNSGLQGEHDANEEPELDKAVVEREAAASRRMFALSFSEPPLHAPDRDLEMRETQWAPCMPEEVEHQELEPCKAVGGKVVPSVATPIRNMQCLEHSQLAPAAEDSSADLRPPAYAYAFETEQLEGSSVAPLPPTLVFQTEVIDDSDEEAGQPGQVSQDIVITDDEGLQESEALAVEPSMVEPLQPPEVALCLHKRHRQRVPFRCSGGRPGKEGL